MTLEKAIEIAVAAHKEQIDKAGQPYVLHPLRMMFQMETEIERIVAVLHDVLEDTSVTPSDLEEQGATPEILTALDHLTRLSSESYDEFILRASQNPIARKVKLADLWDNMDLRRISKVTDKDLARIRKYAEAYRLLNNLNSVATPRFLDALSLAVRLHGADLRKGTSVPYVAHLLGVCALVLLDGGAEDEAIAALLHDALEDHATEISREDIAKRFGAEVLAIVEACTDTPIDYQGGSKPDWRKRKTAYLEHLRKARPEKLRVALADKLDNVRSILADYRHIGDTLWTRFNAGKQDQLWFFRSLVDVFRQAGAKGFLMDELERSVAEVERIVGAD